MRAGWLLGGLAALAVSAAWAPRPPREAAAGSARERMAAVRAADLVFHRQRSERDPTGAMDLVRLGALYLERFRSEGNEADALEAEAAARTSLARRAVRNAPALQLLAAALLGQHRFLEAKDAARQLAAEEPDAPGAQAILGEVRLELGEDAAADRTFRGLTPQRFTPAVAPRYARWLELRGRTGEARRLLEWARDEVARRDPGQPDALAWYELRLGDLALRFGAHGEARARIEAGLALVPDDWRLLAAAARLAWARGDPAAAIGFGDSSLARHLDPATLALVGDAWTARGDTTRAAQYYRALATATQAPRGGFHRAWYLALLDHDMRVPQVLAAVTRDLAVRRDAYGYDLVAWALFKSGRVTEARTAMAKALAKSSGDPLLQAHARAIAAAP